MKQKHIVISNKIKVAEKVILTEKQTHYLRNVLRNKVGNKIILSNYDGDYEAEIKIININSCVLLPVKKIRENNNNLVNIHLYQAVCQQKKLDLIVQKATELGVRSITPITTTRVKVRIDDNKSRAKIDRLKEIATNACQQSKNNTLPQIHNITALNKLELEYDSISLLLDPEAKNSLKNIKRKNTNINLFIGPEGGFTEDEKNIITKLNAEKISFGPRVLRTETAAIAVISGINVLWGDCG
ncbi:MAG: 16S rRNA (uracil(1498)-N(3))-methyltransferase [Pseudomonadota bacterium]|nr:16S rRNA (uracil(1498)-N(3))-methyltransferase [Pseudomonadota bacterium]